jgi:hypothetical protein
VFDAALAWIASHPQIFAATAALSLFMFVGTLLVVPILLVRMRADYFTEAYRPRSFANRHPVWRMTLIVIKNVIGFALVTVGLVMLVLPGQGILRVLIGLSLLDFPGKRRLERRIASQRHVRRSIDWIRCRRGRAPLKFDDDPA